MNEQLTDIGTISGIIGLPLSLLQWWRAERAQKKNETKQSADDTLTEYLEWLRRQNHTELITNIEASQSAIDDLKRLFNQLSTATGEWQEQVLNRLAEGESRLSAQIDALSGQLSRISISQGGRTEDNSSANEVYQQFEVKYLRHIQQEFDRLRMIGVRPMRDIRQRMSIAFVAVKVTRAKDESDPLSAESVLNELPLLTIRGAAGSGKTTLLRWVALKCTHNDPSNTWSRRIPFFIPLRTLIGEEKGQPRLDKLVEYTLRKDQYPISAPPDWIESVLAAKRGVMLIDGVDELPPTQRTKFWDWVREFTDNHPGNRIYISSRHFRLAGEYGGDMWAPPANFRECELEELDDAAIKSLIDNWHDAIETSSLDEDSKRTLRDERTRLPRRLKEPPNRRVRELCRNPLLCSLVCALNWQEEGDLPQKRVALYELCCDLLIDTRDKRRDIKATEGPLQYITKDDKRWILQRLAWEMMCNSLPGEDGQQTEVSKEDAEIWVRLQIPRLQNPLAQSCTPSQIIDYLVDRTNLLREPAHGRIDFPHRTFQEYLAACAAGAQNQHGALVNHALDDQWHQTIVLAAGTSEGGIPFGKKLIETLVDEGEKSSEKRARATYFVLALACCDTARQVEPSLRDRVFNHLGEIAPPTDLMIASVLSVAGDVVLPYLQYRRLPDESAKRVAACARTLALIGTQSAVQMLIDLKGYGGESRATVLKEVCECPEVNPLHLPGIISPQSETARRIFIESWYDDGAVIDDQIKALARKTHYLYLNGLYIPDLRSFDVFTHLWLLNVSMTGAKNVDPVATMQWLSSFSADYCPINGIPDMSSCIFLRSMSLFRTHITSISFLENLSSLKSLTLSFAPVVDFSPLATLLKLEHLSVASTNFNDDDLRRLSSHSDLSTLDIGGTHVTDISPLIGLPKLRRLGIHQLPISESMVRTLRDTHPGIEFTIPSSSHTLIPLSVAIERAPPSNGP